jgi:hypothetical protein
VVRWFEPCALAALLLAPACKTEPTRFVAGPEDARLLDGLSGSILALDAHDNEIHRELEHYTLPDRRHRTWKLFHTVTNFSGPDGEGRIVYNTDDHGFSYNGTTIVPPSHVIRVAHLDGDAEEILVSEDDLLWGGKVLALSASGGWVAYVIPKDEGEVLTVLRIGEGVRWRHALGRIRAGDLCWLKDGKLLVRSGTKAWKETPPEFRPAEPAPSWNGEPGEVPLVFVFDVETGKERILCRGGRPLPVAGQQVVLARDETGYFTIDSETGERIRPGRPLPGALDRGSFVAAALDADRVLYVGRPTEGTKVRTYFEPGIYGYRARPTIKVADLTRGTFATVAQNVLPPITSYGR